MIYLLIFFSIAMTGLMEVNSLFTNKVKLTVTYWGITLFLILFAGTRYKTGFDYLNYVDIYNTVNLENYLIKTIELGFAFLVYVSRSAGITFNGFILLVAAISIWLKARFFKEYSDYIFIALLNYFCIGVLISDMGQMRFGLAVAIALFAFKDCFENNSKGFVIKVILATLVHSSAITLLPAYFISRSKALNRNVMIITFFVMFPIILLDLRPFLLYLADNIPIFQLRAKLRFYIFSDEYGSGLGLNLSFLLRLIIFVLMLLFWEVGVAKYSFYEKMVKLYFFGIMLYIVFNSVAELATRSSAYFRTLDCFFLPFFISLGKTRYEKNIIAVCVILYSLWSLYKIVFSKEFGFAYNPYNSYMLNWFYE